MKNIFYKPSYLIYSLKDTIDQNNDIKTKVYPQKEQLLDKIIIKLNIKNKLVYSPILEAILRLPNKKISNTNKVKNYKFFVIKNPFSIFVGIKFKIER